MQTITRQDVTGRLQMIFRDKETGEVVDQFDEMNTITEESFSLMLKRMTYPTGNAEIAGAYLYQFILGDDVGTGSLLNPQPAVSTLTSSDQNVVYTVPNSDMAFNYVSNTELELRTVLDGDVILDNFFPAGTIEMRYCSATIRYQDGTTFSYKRFPVRSLSRLINIEIIWNVNFSEDV